MKPMEVSKLIKEYLQEAKMMQIATLGGDQHGFVRSIL